MSEVIVLDTHIWLWIINANFDRFPAQWRDRIDSSLSIPNSTIAFLNSVSAG